jgi:catechol 2,3-dioxygenase-like lactoylglutathione lyase family enzyme
MLRGIAHTAVCVADVDAAVKWYERVLGLSVLSPPYLMEGEQIERDMAGLVPSPVAVKAAILGTAAGGDRVLEVIEYPRAPGRSRPDARVTDYGFTHVGLVCDDVEVARRDLEDRGVRFLKDGVARVAGLRTAWFEDPWGNVFILMSKRDPGQPYYRQPVR